MKNPACLEHLATLQKCYQIWKAPWPSPACRQACLESRLCKVSCSFCSLKGSEMRWHSHLPAHGLVQPVFPLLWNTSSGAKLNLPCVNLSPFLLLFLKKKLFIYLFIFWLHWVFVAVHGLSLVAVIRGYSSMRCVGFSLWWLLLLWSMGSRHVGFSSCGSRALEHRLSSCGAWAYLLCSMWDPPGPGLKPVSPAMAGDS